MNEAYTAAKDLIQTNRDRVEAIANALLKYETLDAEDVKVILRGEQLNKPTVSDLLAAEQAKTAGGESTKSEEKKGESAQ
jgi:cell division protease FtsH